MSSCCNIPYPIERSGTSQIDRVIKELVPSYIKIDERSIADIVAFAHEYGGLLNYYNTDNLKDGNWQPFFESSNTVLLAMITAKNMKAVDFEFETLLDAFETSSTDINAEAIISFLYNIAGEIELWKKSITDLTSLRQTISVTIKELLDTSLKTLIGFDKKFGSVNDYSGFYNDDWVLDETTFNGLPSLSYNVDAFANLFKPFYQAQIKIITKAKPYFQLAIQKNNNHPPHVALFISFIYLFKYAQDNLNELTKRHLDFYYKEVLRLEKQKEIPDQVHVIFELAKNYSTNKLESGTLLKAGKDDAGNNLFYALDEEIVVNKATVDQIKTVFIDTNNQYKIYAAAKANSTDGEGTDFEESSNKNWKPFGSSNNKYGDAGLAIASPILLLKEGERTVTISINDTETNITSEITTSTDYFRIEISTEKEWYEIKQYEGGSNMETEPGYQVYSNGGTSINSLKFIIRLHPDIPGLIPFDSNTLDGDFDTQWPVIKIYLNTGLQIGETYGYEKLKSFELKKINIKVDVSGVRDLILQNDSSKFEVEKPFLPFGAEPTIGSNFYIGSEEIFSKQVDSLRIFIDWMDLPVNQNFSSYYSVYTDVDGTTINDESFRAKVSYLNNFGWESLLSNENDIDTYPLLFNSTVYPFLYWEQPIYFAVETSETASSSLIFEKKSTETDAEAESKDAKIIYKKAIVAEDYSETEATPGYGDISIEKNFLVNRLNNIAVIDVDASAIQKYQRYDGILDLEQFDGKTKRGFLKIQLAGLDFQHKRFNEIYSIRATQMADQKPTDTSSTDYDNCQLPNKPYTPNIRSIYLNYTSSLELNLQNSLTTENFEARVEKIFQVNPFGHKELHPNISGSNKIYMFPQFVYNNELSIGNLYLGLKNASPSQNISLLFQVFEGTGNPEISLPTIKWKYLKDNEWIDFKTYQVVNDTTKGLVKSGIIKFSLPSDIGTGNTLFDDSLLWINACIKENIDALPDLIEIKAQAVIASFQDNNNSTAHLQTALPADTISKLKETDQGIKSISQPYASFNGKVKESDDNFYIRVSERLRHKNRAITIWDYEHLILNTFPSIYKVKCINHTYVYNNVDHENAPGHVMVVVIPDLKNKNAVNIYEPKVDVGSLKDISDFLLELDSPFLKKKADSTQKADALQVVNPYYEKIRVSLKVKFYDGYDASQYKIELNDAIKQFLAPWAYDVNASIEFGKTLHKSVILNYIEELEFVDYLTDFKVFVEGSLGDESIEEIKTSKARSVLTTVSDTNPENEHSITTID
jgi:hypothetical protein